MNVHLNFMLENRSSAKRWGTFVFLPCFTTNHNCLPHNKRKNVNLMGVMLTQWISKVRIHPFGTMNIMFTAIKLVFLVDVVCTKLSFRTKHKPILTYDLYWMLVNYTWWMSWRMNQLSQLLSIDRLICSAEQQHMFLFCSALKPNTDWKIM